MRRISLSLALLGAVAAAGCGGAGNGSDGSGGARGVTEGYITVTIQDGQGQPANSPLKITGGKITSSPAGINCGVDTAGAPLAGAVCSFDFPLNSTITLTAAAATGAVDPNFSTTTVLGAPGALPYQFFGWAGDCQGEAACVLTGNADKYVVAQFAGKRTTHPNWTDPAAHIAAFGAGTADCKSCHGSALQGIGIAVGCATCHPADVVTDFINLPPAPPAGSAPQERCDSCHAGAGASHQATYNKYTDTTLVATIDSVAVTPNVDATFNTTVTFTLKKAGVAFDLANTAQKRYSATKYDPATKTFDTATAVSFAAAKATATPGTYKVAAANAKFDVTAGNSFLYFYFGESLVVPASGHYNLMDNVASVAKVYGTMDYVSSANVSACENCHGVPYMKHGYRAAKVAGLPDMVACKACHTDQRVGTDFDWQVLVNEPATLATVTANGTQAASWTTGLGLSTAANYPYVANVMNDTHMSHAMEFAYPQSMANCATCHAGKLDVVLADAKFTGTTCKSCHATTALLDTAKRAPSFAGPVLGPNLAYHDFNWLTGKLIEDTTEVDCTYCHADNIADGFVPGVVLDPADPKATDGVGPFLFGLALPVPLFKDLHPGYNDLIYANTAGARYASSIAATISAAHFDPATKLLTVSFSVAGANAAAIIKPTVVVSLYGYDTKDFIVGGHGSAADGKRNLEWTEASTSNNTARLAVAPATATAGNTSWTATANLSSFWDAYLASTTIKRAEVGILPALGLDQLVAPQNDATKAGYNPYIAITGVTKTVDLRVLSAADDALIPDANAYGKAIVDPAKCNKCHDALAVEFHGPNYGGAGVVGCRLCHIVGSGGSHLEMQSRSIDSYVHAIHSFQKMDIASVNFADPVQAMEYEHHIESTYPNFTTLNCESCHNSGTYNLPDQSKSMPGILSASTNTLIGKTRAIGGVPSVVTGPGARACGGCHRAELIKEDNAAGLDSYDSHTKAFGYREVPVAPETISGTLLRMIYAIFGK